MFNFIWTKYSKILVKIFIVINSAANETCPQPQTSEHLAAVENMNLKNIIIVQNKIDIVMKDNIASEQYNHIKRFVQGTNAQNSPIIPVSAQLKYNVDVVVEYLTKIPIPVRDFVSPPKFIVVRCNIYLIKSLKLTRFYFIFSFIYYNSDLLMSTIQEKKQRISKEVLPEEP